MNLSPWFTPDIKPKRKGVYLTTQTPNLFHDKGFWFQYWTGRFWKLRSDSVDGAYKFKEFKSQHQKVYWRGIEK